MIALRMAALALALSACSQPPEEPSEVAPAPLAVRVVAVGRGEITDVLTAGGETAALATLRLASPVIRHSKPIDLSVGGSTHSSPATDPAWHQASAGHPRASSSAGRTRA